MNKAITNTQTLGRYLRLGELGKIAEILRHEHPVDIVSMIGELPVGEVATVLSCLERDKQAALFGYFDHETQVDLAEVLDRAEMARIFGAMAHDERENLLKLAVYSEGTVGSAKPLPADLIGRGACPARSPALCKPQDGQYCPSYRSGGARRSTGSGITSS